MQICVHRMKEKEESLQVKMEDSGTETISARRLKVIERSRKLKNPPWSMKHFFERGVRTPDRER